MSKYLYRHVRISLFWLASTAVAAFAPYLPTRVRTVLHAATHNGEDSTTTVGVIGCGTIASAIVTGLAVHNEDVAGITVSRRSEKRSSALQAKFPNLVAVSDSNQAVVQSSNIIFLTVLPEQTERVMKELQFDPERHILVSLVSTADLDALRSYSKLPASSIYKMICLPAVAYNEGVCLLQASTGTALDTPKHQKLHNLLMSLGGVVMAENDDQMSAMMVPTGLMGSFYGVLRNNRDWLVGATGMTKNKATYVIARYYYGMMQDAARQCGDEAGASAALDLLIEEQTPGGLNEQGLANLEALGAMESYNKVQDAILSRIKGESDGSL